MFGLDGVADSIMTGFADKTKSDFETLFDDLQKIIDDTKFKPPSPAPIPISPTGALPGMGVGTLPGRIGGVQEFQEGGIVGGPIGQPQLAVVHGGETVLPTHKSYQMAAPIIPTGNLNVSMSGGFNISGGEQAGRAAVQAAMDEMTENFRIAVQRLARRN